MTITQKVYAHLAPEAWEQDYHRVSFVVPDTDGVYALTKRKPPKQTASADTSRESPSEPAPAFTKRSA